MFLIFFQMLSLEDVERIMDETQEGIEYQRVRYIHVLVRSIVVFFA